MLTNGEGPSSCDECSDDGQHSWWTPLPLQDEGAIRDAILGPLSPLWLSQDGSILALTLWTSWCRLRTFEEHLTVSELIRVSAHCWSDQPLPPPTVRIVQSGEVQASLAARTIFIGAPLPGVRPSPWSDPTESVLLPFSFCDYAAVRSDKKTWLRCIGGCTLLCNCNRPRCHGLDLVDLYKATFPVRQVHGPPALWVALEDEEQHQHDEVGWYASIDEKPGAKSDSEIWMDIMGSILQTEHRVFWEIMAGEATLSSTFENRGWSVATPIDVRTHPAMNLLNPLVMSRILTVIQAGRVSFLWLAPACASFSMACNGTPST